ncbi:alpha/beta fold hydrolase [Sphingomonas canadensis]|uniref:Alpha/beta fold hydrolase n=1 Tax=Sphingomonas canadensis TaxID=1219257 RepID=A0ABW3HFU9_9SPHN|nr:alpha/beta hydrolase [Sphingomonas canadensis]MCW3838235.1 alpha/beta hydrolase [Sphingomonas canadensis]
MTIELLAPAAAEAPTRFVERHGRRIAYRETGSGTPLILCLRFRGVLDSWDPAFLDALAAEFRVITFDYSGLGQSGGAASYRAEVMARDAIDLADALGIESFAVGGWSLGGMAAQVVTAMVPERVTHLVLIGTTPPGRVEHPSEAAFLEHALKPVNDLADEEILFFEPASASSRAAAAASNARIAARSADRSPPIAPETYLALLQDRHAEDLFPDAGGYRDFLANCGIPILVIAGDHEIVFPTPNWFALNRVWKSLHLMVLPQMGHGPQHQAPEFVADLIKSFVRTRQRADVAA